MVLDPESRVLRVSKVFDWFSEDFEPEGGVLSFVTSYAPSEEATWLKENAGRVSSGIWITTGTSTTSAVLTWLSAFRKPREARAPDLLDLVVSGRRGPV